MDEARENGAVERPATQGNETASGVRSGVRAFGARQVLGECFGFGYSILIARILTPYDFGVFSICMAALALLSLAGNAGLTTPIIRHPEHPGLRLLQSLFTAYLGLAVLVFGMVWIVAPLLPRFYPELEPGHIWLVRVMAIGILIQPWGGVPYGLLERDLKFRQVANVEFAETIGFNVVALVLAFLGLGVWALAIAAVARPLITAVGYSSLKRWSPRLTFDRDEVKRVIHLSLATQTSAVAASLREQLYPIFVGSICGPTDLGFLTWARSSATKPLMAAHAFDRMAVPWYARTHRETGDLRSVVLLSISMLASVLYPITGIMLALAEPFILYVYGPKWLPALPAFRILCLAMVTAPLRGPLQSAIESQANASILYKCAFISLTVQWIVGIGGTLAWGFVGAAMAVPVHFAAISAFCFHYSRKNLNINPVEPLFRPGIHALLTGLCTHGVSVLLARSFAGFCMASLFGVVVAAILAPIVQPDATRKWLKFVGESLHRPKADTLAA